MRDRDHHVAEKCAGSCCTTHHAPRAVDRPRHVVFHVAWKEGRGQRQCNVRVRAETILALADAIRCCPNHINEDPRTGKRGPEHPPTWIGHALWHLQHPTAVRPCLDHGTEIIDVDRALRKSWSFGLVPDEEDEDYEPGRYLVGYVHADGTIKGMY